MESMQWNYYPSNNHSRYKKLVIQRRTLLLIILRMFSLLTFMTYLHQSGTHKDTLDYSTILLQTGYKLFSNDSKRVEIKMSILSSSRIWHHQLQCLKLLQKFEMTPRSGIKWLMQKNIHTQSHASGNKEHCNLEVGPGISPSYYECCP